MFALIITWRCKEKFDDVYLIRSSWIIVMKLVLFDTTYIVKIHIGDIYNVYNFLRKSVHFNVSFLRFSELSWITHGNSRQKGKQLFSGNEKKEK